MLSEKHVPLYGMRRTILILPNIGEKWKHYKGTTYVILGFAWCATGATLQLRVRYRKCAPGPEFSRTLDNFLGPVGDRIRFEKAE